MAGDSHKRSIFKIFRYDPTTGGKGRFERFELDILDERITTILDALLLIQREYEPSLAFRYACRVSMCGSCGMVINGRDTLACKTVLADLKGEEITVRPLNHFPIVKDLVVDMAPFFQRYHEAMPYFVAGPETDEPAVIRPDSKERQVIGLSTECIACGCCVSSCTMTYWHKDYLGPAALNRAFTLLADSRDGLHEPRLAQVLASCYNCRLEFNCTEVCPKDISPTRAIRYIQRLAAKAAFVRQAGAWEAEAAEVPMANHAEVPTAVTRRRFLSRVTLGLGAVTTLFLGGLLTVTALVPSLRKRQRQWVRVGKLEDFQPQSVGTVNIHYEVEDGFYKSRVTKPVLVSRQETADEITVFSSRCPHLGCTVRWDERKSLFLCACHGGVFYPDGRVKAGPPPRPLHRYPIKVKEGELLVLEA